MKSDADERHQRTHIEVSGSIDLDGRPSDLFSLFTPEGERSWVPDWDPRYPAPEAPKEAPGSTFVTHSGATTSIWVIATLDRTACRGRYVSLIPGARAALVSVDAVGTDPGKTRIDVSYRVTSLSPDHDQEVSDFGAGFGAMLSGWRRLILG